MRRLKLPAVVVTSLLLLLLTALNAAAPATKPASPQASIRPETWEQDNVRLKAQAERLAVKIAEIENRPAPATRPAPAATSPTSRPVALLIGENKRLVGQVNAMLERIASKKGAPPLSKGVSEISISFSCQGKTIDDIAELLGMTGPLAAEQPDGTLRYEWQFRILNENGRGIAAIQPWVCDVVDGKIVSNQMLERRPVGGVRRDSATPAKSAAKSQR
jgi:hypothetical protein